MKIDLAGKTALVTGASGELGRVIALTLARCGADVGVHFHRNRAGAEGVAAEIAKLGRRTCLLEGDVAAEEVVRGWGRKISKDLGWPDIIVNNAIIKYQWKPVLDQGLEDYESQFRSCVLQNVLMAQVFAPAMIGKKYGRIIAINTECAMLNLPTQSAYVAGKRGMDGVLRVLAREVGPHGITVNQVAPGWVISDKDRRAGTSGIPPMRSRSPWAIAARTRMSRTPWPFSPPISRPSFPVFICP
jgi:3-oxoacyl-[acyl-carrier protein] reductase